MAIKYASEADLCTSFMARAAECGFTTFPEVGRWDLVLAWDRDDHVETIGVQAKMTQSWYLLSQALRRPLQAPNFRAVLVPQATKEFRALTKELRLLIYDGQTLWRSVHEPDESYRRNRATMRLPIVSGVGTPGSPSPERLTPWRERAITLCHLLRTRGWISGHDFDGLGVNRGTWLNARWVVADETSWDVRSGRRSRLYVRGPETLPDERYPNDVRVKVFEAWAAIKPWLAAGSA